MSVLKLEKAKAVIADFLDTAVIPSLGNSPLKWIFGGSTAIVLSRLETYIEPYIPTAQSLGIMDQNKNINIEIATQFIEKAFEKEPKVTINLLGIPISFNKDDGNTLIGFMNRYKEQE